MIYFRCSFDSEHNMHMTTASKRTLSPALAVSLVCVFCIGISSASGAEIKVLSANMFQPGLLQLAEQFKQATGHDVKIDVPRGAELPRLVASEEPADILLGTTMAVD